MGWKTLGLKEAIKEMLHDSGMTQKGVCEAAGYKSVGYSVCLVKDGPNEEGYLPIPVDAKSVKGAEKKGS